MGAVVNLWDRLTNVMSGMGTTIDRRTASFYAFTPMSGEEAEAGYRTSWLNRKIVDVPPFDMTREGRDWQAKDSDIEAVEAEERRLQLWPKLQRGLVLARLYGGGVIIIGTADKPEEELDPDRVKKDGLTYLHVMSRQQLTVGDMRKDPADPWFGQPLHFEITTNDDRKVRLHPSRVIAFLGQKAPEGAFHSSESWFWGDPIMQSIGEAVRNADLAQAGFASLIDEAAVDIVKIPDLMSTWSTAENEKQLGKRVAAAKLGKSNYRTLYLDSLEDWQTRQITWAGIPDIISTYLNVVAGAADIPVTRLLGQSPKGLQSTGEGEERDYHSMVAARQNEMLAPALDRIDDLLIRSALGSRPDDIYYEFAPLSQLSEKDAAAVDKQTAETLKVYGDTGLIHEEALAEIGRNKMIETGRFPGCEAAFEKVKNALAEPEETVDPAELGLVATESAPSPKPLRRAANDGVTVLVKDYSPDQPRDPGGTATGGQWKSIAAASSGRKWIYRVVASEVPIDQAFKPAPRKPGDRRSDGVYVFTEAKAAEDFRQAVGGKIVGAQIAAYKPEYVDDFSIELYPAGKADVAENDGSSDLYPKGQQAFVRNTDLIDPKTVTPVRVRIEVKPKAQRKPRA